MELFGCVFFTMHPSCENRDVTTGNILRVALQHQGKLSFGRFFKTPALCCAQDSFVCSCSFGRTALMQCYAKERVLICNCVGFSGYFYCRKLVLETTPWLPDNQALVLFNVMVLVDWHSLINFHGFVQNQAESSTCNSWNFYFKTSGITPRCIERRLTVTPRDIRFYDGHTGPFKSSQSRL